MPTCLHRRVSVSGVCAGGDSEAGTEARCPAHLRHHMPVVCVISLRGHQPRL